MIRGNIFYPLRDAYVLRKSLETLFAAVAVFGYTYNAYGDKKRSDELLTRAG